jgi:hypothetical protein
MGRKGGRPFSISSTLYAFITTDEKSCILSEKGRGKGRRKEGGVTGDGSTEEGEGGGDLETASVREFYPPTAER